MRSDTPRLPAGLEVPARLWDELFEAYGSPSRHYHDVVHLLAVIEQFHAVADDVGWIHPHEVFLAVLFHDAIYVPGAHDNEARSAVLAREAIARFFPQASLDVPFVERLIHLTARHGSLSSAEVTD